MSTSSKDDAHEPLVIVQRNVFNPEERPLTVASESFADGLKVPLPAITVQVPVPGAGSFASSTADDVATVWSGPAFAAGAAPLTVTLNVHVAVFPFTSVAV